MFGSMHYLISDVSGRWYWRIIDAAEKAGVDPAVIERFKAAMWKEHDGPETHTRISDEAWQEMLDALHEKGIRAADL